ncbi:MAG: hypothetical protein LBR13_03310, partial [Dysgonamonadaceae bacterium]|nr:hypothetical protein [Dysgonamonadaceae bacterium]
FFPAFDAAPILGKIDFAVKRRIFNRGEENQSREDEHYFLWAEAKQRRTDILAMLTQLILTIGKARTFDDILPPNFLGCFDCEKIAFVPYSEIQNIFYQNDFNWNVAPSDKNTREFQLVLSKIRKLIEIDAPFATYLFDFARDAADLKKFIKLNFIQSDSEADGLSPIKTPIDKNNFITIYDKWYKTVKPTIQVDNWDAAKRAGILEGDFYLADLLSDEDKTLKDKLFVLLKSDHYELEQKIDELGFKIFRTTGFSDNQKAYNRFWTRYKRPPATQYWDYIVERRDLLVPQDVRERKGSFFTPAIWVEKSHEYLAQVFGSDWQDEYYVWDCAAGTGNLLAGLTNKYRIWASTLDKQDVDVMHDRIKNGANLLDDHVFQFDFLNDSFDKLPEGLRKIIADEKLRKRLIVYINPPYAEGDSKIGRGRRGVHESKIHDKYLPLLGKASGELYAQFFIRIYKEIDGCILAEFSKLKMLQSPNFEKLRRIFLAKLENMFIIPANSFDNVKGEFPIGFKIWNTSKKVKNKEFQTDIYNENNQFIGKKIITNYDGKKYISEWLENNTKKKDVLPPVAHLASIGNDFQHQRDIYIDNVERKHIAGGRHTLISLNNFIVCCVFYTVRKVIPADWLNDRDQFLYPNNGWETDLEFQNDCLTYALFTNNISAKYGTNHWIPFSEQEVNARTEFDSHFMLSFLSGKIVKNAFSDMFEQLEFETNKNSPNWKVGEGREFSDEAVEVFDAAREIWKYYHTAPLNPPSGGKLSSPCGGGWEGAWNVNASYYDIRAYFKRVEADSKGKDRMNARSQDERFNSLERRLNKAIGALSEKIAPKIYKYEFLLE